MKNKKLSKIAELLPEGLGEETVNKIVSLIAETIQSEVKGKTDLLTAKVKAFLISNREEIKESALRELTEESEIFGNAQKFDELKAFMSLEINERNDENAVGKSVAETQELAEENTVLVSTLNEQLLENKKLKKAVKILETKLKELVKTKNTVTEELNESIEKNKLPFKSSEIGIIISDNMNEKEQSVKEETNDNEFLTEGVMELMPRIKQG